jgi:anti-sigma regulatory factor (Ser/Thr protein kinase)
MDTRAQQQGRPVHRAPPAPQVSVMPVLGALTSAVGEVRAHAVYTLREWRLDCLVSDVELVVNELAANAVRASTGQGGRPAYHNGSLLTIGFQMELIPGRLTAEVWDQAPGTPSMCNPDWSAESGRGLMIVSGLADEWGWKPLRKPWKTVWAAWKVGA